MAELLRNNPLPLREIVAEFGRKNPLPLRERVAGEARRVRGSYLNAPGDLGFDCLQNPVQILGDTVIPEPEHTITSAFKPLCSFGGVVCMLPTIQFDDQSRDLTDKVDDVAPHPLLPSKLASIELAIAKHAPQCPLSVRRVPSQRSRKAQRHGRNVPLTRAPSTSSGAHPLPQGGRGQKTRSRPWLSSCSSYSRKKSRRACSCAQRKT